MYTYIVIDDEKLIRQGTIKKISGMGEDLVRCIGEADNGKEGIDLIEQVHPDITVLDMQMPVMGGTELLPYLTEHYPEMPLIVISGFQDFEYLRHAIQARAIDYVLKPFNREAIQKAMEGAIQRLASRSEIQNQIISNEEEKEAAYYEYDLQMLKNLIFGYHTLASAISSRRLSYINDTHNLFLAALYASQTMAQIDLQSFLDENGFGDLALYLAPEDMPHLGFLIFFIPENPAADPIRTLRQITGAIACWLRQQGYVFTAGISAEHRNLTELHTAFQECSSALNTQPIQEKMTEQFLFFSGQDIPEIPLWPRQEEFLFRLEAGMKDETSALVDQLFDFYQTVPGCTLASIKFHCYQLSAKCREILRYYFPDQIHSDASSMQNVVTSLFSLEEVKHYYLGFFMNMCTMLSSQNVYSSDNVVEKLKFYVQRNYQQDLSLDFLSSWFYMNRSYLSHLFKQKTGCNFVDYVNEVRIEKAKQLLLQPDRKMYQVAKAVGYDNVKYFYRVFRKSTGMTPVQYQEQHCEPHAEADQS